MLGLALTRVDRCDEGLKVLEAPSPQSPVSGGVGCMAEWIMPGIRSGQVVPRIRPRFPPRSPPTLDLPSIKASLPRTRVIGFGRCVPTAARSSSSHTIGTFAFGFALSCAGGDRADLERIDRLCEAYEAAYKEMRGDFDRLTRPSRCLSLATTSNQQRGCLLRGPLDQNPGSLAIFRSSISDWRTCARRWGGSTRPVPGIGLYFATRQRMY